MIVFILGFSVLFYFSLYSALLKADGAFIVSVSPVTACDEFVFVIISGIGIAA